MTTLVPTGGLGILGGSLLGRAYRRVGAWAFRCMILSSQAPLLADTLTRSPTRFSFSRPASSPIA